jgi:hypothetical protein
LRPGDFRPDSTAAADPAESGSQSRDIDRLTWFREWEWQGLQGPESSFIRRAIVESVFEQKFFSVGEMFEGKI